jgi:hypothetical protein
MGFVDKVNDAIQDSVVGRFFKLEERKTNFFTEMRGGTATFMAMAYILAVNPSILADSGGPCEADDPNYNQCIEQIKREYVTGTAVAAMFGCLLMVRIHEMISKRIMLRLTSDNNVPGPLGELADWCRPWFGSKRVLHLHR